MTVPKHTAQPQMGLLTVQDVIDAHRAAEQYLRRLLFIGLRVNDVQYESAENLIDLTRQTAFFPIFEKSIALLFAKVPHQTSFDAFWLAHSDLMLLVELFTGYATPVRYRLAKGIDELNRAEAYKTAYHISKSLVVEMQRTLKTEFGHSAFAAPKEWGARTISVAETTEQIIARLGLQHITGAPIALNDVQKRLAQTIYTL